jgi:hypothetical protein
MLDVLFVLCAIGFFVVSFLYVYGCEWFVKDQPATTERLETIHAHANP